MTRCNTSSTEQGLHSFASTTDPQVGSQTERARATEEAKLLCMVLVFDVAVQTTTEPVNP